MPMTRIFTRKFDTPYKAIKLWNGEPGSLRLMSKGVNLVYQFQANGQQFTVSY